MGKLQRISAQLAELSPEQGAPFQQRCQAVEEQYSAIREHVRQASTLMGRMDLLLECLERLQSRVENPPAVRAEAAHLREQISENSLALGELEKLGVALETVRSQGAELLARLGCLAGTLQALMPVSGPAVIQERTEQLLGQWSCLRSRGEERQSWLRGLLVLADQFWQGLADLTVTLADTQQMVLDLEEAGPDPSPTPQALREEIDSLQGELDTLGVLGSELMSSCGELDRPGVPRSLDEVSDGPCWGWAGPPQACGAVLGTAPGVRLLSPKTVTGSECGA
uniref:Uncharacterized protein n=1 Tax=Pelusios castaneus TaxID=367368 RepID=A0A8C8VMS4_9SAUR